MNDERENLSWQGFGAASRELAMVIAADGFEQGFIDRVSIRHSVSPDPVRTILCALRSSGGRMAQFSHSDFGGMSQWSPGMSMVGDMFNNSLKSKLDAVEQSWRLTSLNQP